MVQVLIAYVWWLQAVSKECSKLTARSWLASHLFLYLSLLLSIVWLVDIIFVKKITYHYITMSNWKMSVSDLPATILAFTSQAFPPAWVLCRLPVGISFISLHQSWPHFTSKIWRNPYWFSPTKSLRWKGWQQSWHALNPFAHTPDRYVEYSNIPKLLNAWASNAAKSYIGFPYNE